MQLIPGFTEFNGDLYVSIQFDTEFVRYLIIEPKDDRFIGAEIQLGGMVCTCCEDCPVPLFSIETVFA
jgi:hypothetical protein